MSNSCSNQNHNQKGDAKNQNNESCQKNSQNQANQCNANHEHKNDKRCFFVVLFYGQLLRISLCLNVVV
ncbi:hypothetical protein VN0186_01700 [Helicobacter pylori]|nr:hypothetical protein VN1221_04850 [Helicobacter pylori]